MKATRDFVKETMYGLCWVEYFPRVYPNMDKKDFLEWNEDMIFDMADRAANVDNNNYEREIDATEEQTEVETEYLYEWMTEISEGINKKKPSKIRSFPTATFAKTFMNVHYKQHGMLFFPVWSKNDNRFLLFYVWQR